MESGNPKKQASLELEPLRNRNPPIEAAAIKKSRIDWSTYGVALITLPIPLVMLVAGKFPSERFVLLFAVMGCVFIHHLVFGDRNRNTALKVFLLFVWPVFTMLISMFVFGLFIGVTGRSAKSGNGLEAFRKTYQQAQKKIAL